MREVHRRASAARAGAASVLALLLVWVGLTMPNQVRELTPLVFLRLPLEGVLVLVLVVLLPARLRSWTAVLLGIVLGLVTLSKLLDMGFFETLNRPFDPILDWRYLGSLSGLLDDSLGRTTAIIFLVGAGLLIVGLLVLMPLAVLRLTRLAAAHRRQSLRVLGGAGLVWALCAVLGVQVVTGTPVASVSAATYAYDEVTRIPSVIRDERAFAQAAAQDPLRDTPGDQLLTGLRGKDVLIVFVESYGRVAVQGSSFSPGVDAVLDSGTRRLDAAGFSTRSAFMTSPTFGAISWLAHSTLQSGLWIDSQQRYDVAVTSTRVTLSDAFKRAGWRTVADVPADDRDWPQADFYGYDKVYDSRNVGYAGPRFGYPTMPDQYTLHAFHRLELAPHPRRPVMAEIDLISSHAPWSRTPHMIPERLVGDGSAFDGMPERLPSQTVVWRSPDRVRAAYGQSIEYSMKAVISFVLHHADRDTVLVVLGDHQPATIVTGAGADHDVPVTVVARDPAVMKRIADWGWEPGLRPDPDAPVWRMDSFRDRFLDAFADKPGAGRAAPPGAH